MMDTYIMISDTMEAVPLVAAQKERKSCNQKNTDKAQTEPVKDLSLKWMNEIYLQMLGHI